MLTVNGKEYPLWSQFVEQKERWIGGILKDSGDSIDNALGYSGDQTEIVDIKLEPNGDDSAFFTVEGKDFECGFDVQHGGISGKQNDKNAITFSGYMGHTWSIQERE
jgi:hypothetical protein